MSNGRPTGATYRTWQQGYQEAESATSRSLLLESSLPPSPLVEVLSTRIFPAYLEAAQRWSDLLASGLPPPAVGVADGRKDALARWKMCLERANRIKLRVKDMGGEVVTVAPKAGPGASSVASSSSPRVAVDSTADADLNILRRASTICSSNGHAGRPIALRLDADWSAHRLGETILATSNRDSLSLSTEQKRWGARWSGKAGPRSPAQSGAWSMHKLDAALDTGSHSGFSHPTASQTASIRVEQGIGANCSVVAGLEACVEHEQRFGSKLGENCIERLDDGQFKVRLLLNGAWRYIIVDSSLPICDHQDVSMHAVAVPTTYPPTLASIASAEAANKWVTIVEKAYMAATAGGYDSPGSTSELDLLALTGWLPETIHFRDADFRRENTWRRLAKAHERGQCLLTLGTGEKVSSDLAPKHAYVLAEMRDDLSRTCRIVNPWKDERNIVLERDGAARGESHLADLREEDEDEQEQVEAPARHTLEMSWDQVCDRFDHVAINWDPRLFENRIDCHGESRARTGQQRARHVIRRQFRLESPASGAEVYVLVTRHRKLCDRHDDGSISMAISIDEDASETSAGQARVPKTFHKKPVLPLRYTCIHARSLLSVNVAIEGDPSRASYSISLLSDANIGLVSTRQLHQRQDATIAFSKGNAGGNVDAATYLDNPQHRVVFSAIGRETATPIRLRLTSSEPVALRAQLVRGRGERLDDLSPGDVVLDTGEYTYEVAEAERPSLPLGSYTLVTSTYDHRPGASVQLSIEADSRVVIHSLPSLGAGLFQRSVTGSLDASFGRPALGQYDRNPRIEMVLPRPSRISGRLTLTGPETPSNVTIFWRETGGRLGDQVATSGLYSDARYGVHLPSVSLQPAVYVVIVSTFAAGSTAGEFELKMFADQQFELSSVA